MNDGKIWVPVLSLLLAVGGAYLSAQISIAEKIGDKVSREELRESVRDGAESTKRELDDIKKQQERTYQEIQEINKNIKDLIQRDNKRSR